MTVTGPDRQLTIAAELSEFLVSRTLADVPPALVRQMRAHILDTLACAVAGSTEPSTKSLLGALALSDGGEATVIGVGRSASAEVAALANGAMAHALELDDDHRRATVHPGAVVIPAALATAEATKAPGERFLLGVILGYEVMCRIGEAFLGRQFYRGFHPTGTCGVFGSAAAAGVILGLDMPQMTNALGIAGSQAAGLGEWRFDGSWTKRLHPGRSAQSGILAARLAANGFTGPASVLEGESGFLAAFQYDIVDPSVVTSRLGDHYTAAGTAFKPYPGCRFAHAAVDLAIELHDRGVVCEQIEALEVRTFRTDILNDEAEPATAVVAQFSVPYLVGVALRRGSLTLEDLTSSAIHDPASLAAARKVRLTIDPGYTEQYPGRYPTELSARLFGGGTVRLYSDCPSGDPESPVYSGDDSRYVREIGQKVDALLRFVGLPGLQESLSHAIEVLDHSESVAMLAECVGDVRSRSGSTALH